MPKKVLFCNSLLRNYNIPIQDEYFLAKSLDPDQDRLYPGTTYFRPPPNFDHLILCFTKILIV